MYRQKEVWVDAVTEKKASHGMWKRHRRISPNRLLRGASPADSMIVDFCKEYVPVVHSCSVYGNLSWQPQETNTTSKTENPTQLKIIGSYNHEVKN